MSHSKCITGIFNIAMNINYVTSSYYFMLQFEEFRTTMMSNFMHDCCWNTNVMAAHKIKLHIYVMKLNGVN